MEQELLDRVMAATTAEGTLAHTMGIRIVSASGAEVVATMPVAGNIQPFGLLHGGASCVLAETIGSLGAALHAGLGRVVVGIEISATHHRGATGGEVTAVATRAHGGRTLATYEIVITDQAARRICTARLTCLIREQVPGQGGNGAGPAGQAGADGLAEPGADGLAEPGADGLAEPGADGLAEPGADGLAEPGADGLAEPGADGAGVSEG